MFFLYRIGIHLYILAIRMATPFNIKAKKAIQGRKLTSRQPNPFPEDTYVWFHCASLGEFEQGRPVIELIKKQKPLKKILLTFYSPSGYDVRKNYDCADVIVYLPFDTAINVRNFLSKFKISAAIFVKYEIWPNFFAQLHKRRIPLYLISAVFRKKHWYFRWYGRFVKKLLTGVSAIFVQDNVSLQVLTDNGLTNGVLSGDARVDRVIQLKDSILPIETVELFLSGQRAVIFGSVYQSDVSVLTRAIQSLPHDVKLLVAPHEVTPKMIDLLQSVLKGSTLWSSEKWDTQCRVLIIDNVGNLNKVYQYASVVYIGGGFEKSIHNILEPAVFKIPVCFGPKFENFHEAESLIRAGLAFSHKEPANISDYIVKMLTLSVKDSFKQDSAQWFVKHSGATELIYRRLASAI